MIGLHLRYEDYSGINIMRVGGYSFHDEIKELEAKALKEQGECQ